MEKEEIKNVEILNKNIMLQLGDCMELLPAIADKKIDMLLVDLPYGTTQNKWDCPLPLNKLWGQYLRIIKPNGAMVFTAQVPFDKILGNSMLPYLKYEWIWEKTKATGHLNCKKQPLKAHENVLVFYQEQCTYNPQKTPGKPYVGSGGASKKDNYGDFKAVREGSADGSRYPRSVLRFPHESRPQHPTQKPIPLMEYLIKTYTNEGDTVLDNCMGSGTTGIACVRTNRKFIGMEIEEKYFKISKKRINEELQCEWLKTDTA